MFFLIVLSLSFLSSPPRPPFFILSAQIYIAFRLHGEIGQTGAYAFRGANKQASQRITLRCTRITSNAQTFHLLQIRASERGHPSVLSGCVFHLSLGEETVRFCVSGEVIPSSRHHCPLACLPPNIYLSSFLCQCLPFFKMHFCSFIF